MVTRTDAVRIWKDGKAILRFDAPNAPSHFAPQSITKPIAALAVLKLVEQGKIESLDQPIYKLYPEWRQGRKKRITIRHILTHTAGLQNEAFVQAELVHLPDRVQAALAAELEEEPGIKWRYNNKAYWLIGGIIERASGQPAKQYIDKNLFTPLGITDARWTYDPSGKNLDVTGGLHIKPDDLARIGQLVLDLGVYKGQQVIRRELMSQALASATPIGRNADQGLGWRLVRRITRVSVGDSAFELMRSAGLNINFVREAERLRGSYDDWAAFNDQIEKVFGNRNAFSQALEAHPNAWNGIVVEREDKPSYITHGGDGGQSIYIVPTSGIVAVRLIRDHFSPILQSPEFKGKDTSEPSVNRELGRRFAALVADTGFDDFGPLVLRLH